MKTISINLYNINELSEDAQEKARRAWADDEDYSFLEDDILYRLNELLTENKITSIGEPQVNYSLSYCQGDGAMFYGTYQWGTWDVKIEHSGRYYHSYSKNIDIYQSNDDSIEAEKHTYDKFEAIYQSICKELARYGYDCINEHDGMENFKELCDSNDDLFTKDGEKYDG